MRSASLCSLALIVVFGGCSSGSGGLGDSCGDSGDCGSNLQCLAGACEARCQRATECGDGYSCDESGACHAATGEQGAACSSEDACAPGLACEINGSAIDTTNGHLIASCVAENVGHPPAAECDLDSDCKNGTCALGHCTDLCAVTRDCGSGLACTEIPRVDPFNASALGKPFRGCLPDGGNLTWTIPVASSLDHVALPVPASASAVSVVMAVDDTNQYVGAVEVHAPGADPANDLDPLLDLRCSTPTIPGCTTIGRAFASHIRHFPELGQSVLQMPSNPAYELQTGVYDIAVSSLRAIGGALQTGSAVPHVTATVKLDSSALLDLHFYFLNLADHPCSAELGDSMFDADAAQHATAFQSDYVGTLRGVFAHGGVALGTITYEDVTGHPDLDGLDSADLPSLLALGHYAGGINVFFVRTLSPVGIQALGPNPGPAGLAHTRQSGVVIALDSMCYRSWTVVARLTAHEIARYMGLYHNIETTLDGSGVPFADPIEDSDLHDDNLMFYSELGGTDLSAGQRDILTRSPVLR